MPSDQLDLLEQRINESAILTLNKLNHSHAITANMISLMLSKLLLIVTYELSAMKIPTIAIMDGQTIGFGSGTAVCSKIRVVTESAIWMMPETTMGHFTDSSTSYFLSRLKNNYGKYLALCAARMTVEDIMVAGIATHYVPSSKIPSMIGCLTHLKSPSLKELDATINLFTERWPINSLSCTMDVSKDRMMQTIIKECFRYSTVEEILAALEKEGSAFSMKTRDDMLKASPTALKITLELLCQASNLSFIDSIILERRLWNLDMLSHDFQEGYKAIMNKKSPKWYPQSLREVDLEKNIKHDRFHAANALKPMYLRHIEHATFQEDKHFDELNAVSSEYEVIYKCSL
ncbi:ClpP/crotonase-like domain-containing protein [Mucor lusitanicus]|uniref:3-hydroxyisobutyryl-CoA hydrolase n=2 Tax=Mucor circinelloides f. lusitanicus TaxID=29924 RepID=A0A162QRD1_MUCCL|nr:ClpP/crotonase-like domain-containing protein [Mucor lusitanicus]OAD05080.1 hypothetical protein MUCCIDRAFT_161784 [Mucor lusitanicus CBS 277.49]